MMKRVRESHQLSYRKLVRGADGYLKPAAEQNIGDIWAEQRRIRLHDAITEDRRKAAQKRLRVEYGLVGAAWRRITSGLKRLRLTLFGQRRQASTLMKAATRPATQPHMRTLELSVSLPKLKLPKVQLAAVFRQIARRHRKRLILITGSVIALIIIGLVVYRAVVLAPHHAHTSTRTDTGQTTTGPVRGTPAYSTLLPSGKTIDSLGGWYRISPPDRDPVYAYVDHIDGTQIDVSEQPLPPSFKTNTAEQVAQLAASFNAIEKLDAHGTTIYIGTSAKGPQSLIMAKSNLLILLKSSTIIGNDQWVAYINSLQ